MGRPTLPSRTEQVSPELFTTILSPYKKPCLYLKKASIGFHGDGEGRAKSAVGGGVVGIGEFSIPASFYIDDTGHFNSVEFNLCYNQLAYVFLAYCMDNQLIPPMTSVDLEQYRKQQLSGILIVRFESSFRKQMCALDFRGLVSLTGVRENKKFWLLDTHCEYFDQGGGRADGDVLLAFLRPV